MLFARVRSQRLQAAATATLMTLCLGAALGLAHVLAVTPGHRSEAPQRISVGDLTLKVPAHWKPVRLQELGNLLLLAAFQAPNRTTQLFVVELPSQAPRSPQTALREAVEMFRQARDGTRLQIESADVRAWRQGQLIGLGYRRETPIEHFAVVTVDARSYWALWLTDLSGARTTARRLDSLHQVVCNSLQINRFRTAEPGHLFAAGLTQESIKQIAPGLRPIVRADGQRTGPLYLVDSQAPAALQLVRLVHTTDFTDASLPDPLELLTELFTEATKHNPSDTQVRQVSSTSWQAVFHDPVEQMTRELWYVRLPSNRAVQIEILAADDHLPQITGWIDPLVQSISAASSAPTLGNALERGYELAAVMRDRLGVALAPHCDYQLIEQANLPLAYTVQCNETVAGPHSLRGWVKQIWFRHQNVAIFRWTSAEDGSQLDIEQLQAPGLGQRPTGLSRYEQSEGRVTVTDVDGTRHQSEVPRGYILPIAEDHWPQDVLRQWAAEPAIAWFSWEMKLPRPAWVWSQMSNDGRMTVCVRPLEQLDTMRMTLDDSGRVERRVSFANEGQILGPLWYTSRRVSRARLKRDHLIDDIVEASPFDMP